MGGVAHYHVDKRSFLPSDNYILSKSHYYYQVFFLDRDFLVELE